MPSLASSCTCDTELFLQSCSRQYRHQDPTFLKGIGVSTKPGVAASLSNSSTTLLSTILSTSSLLKGCIVPAVTSDNVDLTVEICTQPNSVFRIALIKALRDYSCFDGLLQDCHFAGSSRHLQLRTSADVVVPSTSAHGSGRMEKQR